MAADEQKKENLNPNTEEQVSVPGEGYYQYEEDEIDLLDLALVLAKHKRLIIGIAFVACLVALIL
ncbi:hypothetical protein, partial [Acetomicrobium mobile]